MLRDQLDDVSCIMLQDMSRLSAWKQVLTELYSSWNASEDPGKGWNKPETAKIAVSDLILVGSVWLRLICLIQRTMPNQPNAELATTSLILAVSGFTGNEAESAPVQKQSNINISDWFWLLQWTSKSQVTNSQKHFLKCKCKSIHVWP